MAESTTFQIGQTWMSHKYDPWSEHQSPHLESDPKADPRDRLREHWMSSTFNSLSYQRSLPCPHLQGAYGLVGADTHDRNNYNKVLAYRVPQQKLTKHNMGQCFPTAFCFLLYGCSIFLLKSLYILCFCLTSSRVTFPLESVVFHHLIFLFCTAEFFSFGPQFFARI